MSEQDVQPLVTQCTNCNTQFRVTEAQLQIAKGKVRCGSCLTVFEGVDNLVWDDQALSSPDDSLDALLDELDAEPEAPASEDAGAGQTSEAATTNADSTNPVKPASTEVRDDSWRGVMDRIEIPAEDELIDLGPLYTGPDYATLTRSEPEVSVGRTRREVIADLQGHDAGSDEDPLADAIEPSNIGFEEVAMTELPPAPQDEISANETTQNEATQSDNQIELEAALDDSVPSEPGRELEVAAEEAIELAPVFGEAPLEAEALAAADAEPEREPEPESVAEAHAPESVEAPDPVAAGEAEPVAATGGGRGWLRGGLIGLAALALVAQVLYLQFDSWAVNPTMRPVYVAACGFLGCEVPHRRELSSIKSRNLRVRSHPEQDGMLAVDTVIINEADFPQPYPILHLEFSNVDGNVIATQRFAPGQYLAGEAEGATLIDAKTPVQISIAVDDPGPEALSYVLNFE